MTNYANLLEASASVPSSARPVPAGVKWFVSDWEYDRPVEFEGATFHLWRCPHHEGYTAWDITRQRPNGDVVKPRGSGHYTSLYCLIKRTGINTIIDDEANEAARRSGN